MYRHGNLTIAIPRYAGDDPSIYTITHTREQVKCFLLRQRTCIRQNSKSTPNTILDTVLADVGQSLACAAFMCGDLPDRRAQVFNNLRLGITERQLVRDFIEMCALSTAVKRLDSKPELGK